ncbi:MAG: hypothetical protein R3204_11765 [Oceanospirillum sp.]|nr:hypothetical protein [Oceanospirillum sp.]MDX1399195.1 hypothetical protein [Oceanospirillum sp.]
MPLSAVRQVVALNQRISDSNDQFVRDFQNILTQLDAGRQSMMKNAELLRNLNQPRSANCENHPEADSSA